MVGTGAITSMASLVVGGRGEKILRLERDTLSIGRDSSNALQLDDDKVSREHCRIDRVSAPLKPPPGGERSRGGELEERFWIQDLGSSNGTIVNGTLIERKELEDGDEIKLGNTRILFTLKEPHEIKDSVVQLAAEPEKKAEGKPSVITAAITGTTLFERQIEEMDRESLMRDHHNLRTLYKVNSIIRSVFDVDELLEEILDVVLEVIKGERGFIMIRDDKTGELIPKAVRNRDFKQITISKTIVNKVFETGESILTDDAMSDERFASGKSIVDYQIRSCLCVPLKSKDKILGIIHVDNKVSTRSFAEGDLELLSAIGAEAGVVVENAKLYEQNLRAERLATIGETIAGLSHYIKNILTGLEGGATLVNMGLDRSNEQLIKKGWKVVRSSDERISQLVLNMLDFSKERKPAREKTNVNDIVKEVASLMEHRCRQKSIRIRTICDENIPEINVDPTGIHRAILNLVTNAIDSVEEGNGEITLTTSVVGVVPDADKKKSVVGVVPDPDKNRRVQVSISDNGPGIPQKDVPHIFDLFQSTKGAKGTGLGLAVTKKIVGEHEGQIEVTSQVGQGTTFTVSLPSSSGA